MAFSRFDSQACFVGIASTPRFPRQTFLAIALSGAILMGCEVGNMPVAAQDDPVSAVIPTECTITPLPEQELMAVLKAPPGYLRGGKDGTPVSTPSPPQGGAAADAQTVDLITATAREAVACLNAGDLARLFSLYSDNYLFGVWGGVAGPDLSENEVQERVQALETPKRQPESDQLALIAVDDVEVLPDGRVMATVINNHGESRVVFVKDGDRYLVDWAYPLSGDGTPVP